MNPVQACGAVFTMCLVSLVYRAAASNAIHEPDEQRLYNQIMSNYLKTVRPAVNGSRPLEVLFSMRLNQIVNLDERQQVLTTNVFIDQTWTDPALSWDPTDYKDVRSLRIPADQIWKPDTFIYNNADNGSTGFISGTYIQIRHTGGVTWPVPVRLRSSCVVKIAYFPFDYQFCMVRFGSWIYSHSLVDYEVRADVVSVDLSTYIKNSEWELLSMKLEKSVANRSRGLGLHPHLTAVLYLKRNTFYYLFNIIVPCVMLSMLTLMTFWLPPTSGEKVTLGLSVFLAFSMFMLLIAEEVPASSDAVPLIGIYLCVVMTMTSLSVICAVLVTNLHNRGSKLRPAPRWVASLCIRYLAVPFHVNQDVQLLANTIYLSDYCKFFILHDNRCAKDESIRRKQNGGRASDVSEEQTSDSVRTSLDGREYTSLDPSLLQQNSVKHSERRHRNKHPSFHSHMYHNEQNVIKERIVEEDQAIELTEQTMDSPLIQKTPTSNDSPLTPYKKVCTHDEKKYFSCTGMCGQVETSVDDPLATESSEHDSLLPAVSPSSTLTKSSAAAETSLLDSPKSHWCENLKLSCWNKFKPIPSSEAAQFSDVYRIIPCETHETFCECGNNDEDIWVLRDDFVSPTQSNSKPSCACLDTDSEAEALDSLITETKPNCHLTSPASNEQPSSPGKRRRTHIRQRRSRTQPIYENPKLVLKRAKIMIAEWCTIAKVVDRILFSLSLLATVFAYVFILVFVPAEYNINTQNVTFANSINTGQYKWY